MYCILRALPDSYFLNKDGLSLISKDFWLVFSAAYLWPCRYAGFRIASRLRDGWIKKSPLPQKVPVRSTEFLVKSMIFFILS